MMSDYSDLKVLCRLVAKTILLDEENGCKKASSLTCTMRNANGLINKDTNDLFKISAFANAASLQG